MTRPTDVAAHHQFAVPGSLTNLTFHFVTPTHDDESHYVSWHVITHQGNSLVDGLSNSYGI